MINVIKIKKYRGAHILILNAWQSFVAIVFYRGKFYHCRTDAVKQGEYTNNEYLVALDTITKDAKYLVEALKRKRSVLFQLKSLWKKNIKRSIERRRGTPETEKK